MRHSMTHPSRQKGVVLVIGLLLLLVITIVAVASMGGANMQERMAGNARTQALAFQVASAGASDSFAFYNTHLEAVPPTACTTLDDWDPDDVHTVPIFRPNIGAHQVRLTQQLYCLETPIQPHYFVLSTGEVLAGSATIARRAIETRILTQPPSTFGESDPDCGALCFLGCDPTSTYRFPTSNAFRVDGNGNPAITTPAACRQTVRDAIRDNRVANYQGGIAGIESDLAPPWTDTSTVNQFRIQLLETMATNSAGSFLVDAESPSEGPSAIASAPGHTWQFINPPSETFISDNTTYGTPSNPQITYIAKNADMRGNVSGAGILVVEGDLEWRGTPEFQGLILVLGGKFKVNGGGTGGNFAGSLVVVDIWNNYPSHHYQKPDIGTFLRSGFGPIDLDFRGGGTALYRYDCDVLSGISDGLGLGGSWNPQCGGDDEAGTEEVVEITPRIASWRENIGWRVDFID